MSFSKMLLQFDTERVPYEIIRFSKSILEKEYVEGLHQNGVEWAEWKKFKLDEKSEAIALMSSNYGMNMEQIKKSLRVNKLSISPIFDLNDLYGQQVPFILDNSIASSRGPVLIPLEGRDNRPSYLRVDANQVAKNWPGSIEEFSLTPSYKAKTSQVSPVSMRTSFESLPTCFYGISLENGNFVRSKVLATLEWISNRFKTCTVLIGDSIHRITLESNLKLEAEQAEQTALYLGKKFLIDELSCFERFKSKCAFNFVFCSEIQRSPDYNELHSNLNELFKTDEAFKTSVELFGKTYHLKRNSHLPESEINQLVESSCRYFLEEFAIFGCLYRRGLPAMVYPGSFSTLSEIASGLHPGAPQELKDLVVVSLHIKKR